MEEISFKNIDEQNVQKVITQTNYNREEAIEKLLMFNNDYIKVIKNYMGISEKKEHKIKSVNQAIFKQMRTHLDSSMKEYRDSHPIDMSLLVENLKESDEREKQKK
jgi:hypothetical protein